MGRFEKEYFTEEDVIKIKSIKKNNKPKRQNVKNILKNIDYKNLDEDECDDLFED